LYFFGWCQRPHLPRFLSAGHQEADTPTPTATAPQRSEQALWADAPADGDGSSFEFRGCIGAQLFGAKIGPRDPVVDGSVDMGCCVLGSEVT